MALFPCSRCGKRYRGAQQNAYPTVVAPSVTYSERLRLCPECFELVVKDKAWSLDDLESDSGGLPCGNCGKSPTPTALFCTYYEHGQARADLYGRLCANGCLPVFMDRIWGTSEGWQTAIRIYEHL